MSKKLLKLVLFTLGVLFFTGGACPSNETTASNKVAQSEIYQSYAVRESGQNFEVKAFLRIGGKTGTTLALIAPSKITFNGQPMEEHKNTSSGTFYTITVPNNTASGTFIFTDRAGKIYTNRVELSKVETSPKPMRVNGANAVNIPLTRPASDSASFSLEMNDETIFVSTAPGKDAEAYFDKAKNSIVVLPATWKKFPNGNVSLNLEVRNSVATQQGTPLGGDISFTYDTPPLNVALLKGKSKSITNSALANANVSNTNAVAVIKNSNSNVKKAINKSVGN